MATLGFFSVCLFLLVSSGVSFPEQDIPNVEPEVLDALLKENQFDLVSKLLKIENVNLVRPGERERTLNPMFHKELKFGDILSTKEHEEQSRQGLNFEKYPGNKWPNGYIPYAISSGFSRQHRRTINSSISEWNRKVPCLQLRPRTNERNYVYVFSGDGCYSYMGRTGGQQALSLDRYGCVYLSTIVHEFLHAAGLAHEQNRSDRDKYITMNWENIPKQWQSQYEKTDPNDFGLQGDYDYYSVMHYPVPAPETNKPAFTVKKSGIQEDKIGNGDSFTEMDLKKMSELYC